MIAVTFALPTESKAFISRLQNKRRIPSLGAEVWCGALGSRSLTIFHTGVGRSVAEKKLTEFLGDQSFDVLISSGFAGGVAADLNVADLFLAENVSDPHLFAIAQQALTEARPRSGKLLTSSGIVHSAEQRMGLARERGADAIDMETDVIAQTCVERGIPMLSLRAISDTLRDPFPAPPAVLFDIEQQKTNIAGLAAYLLRKPIALRAFMRFNRQIGRARENLADALTSLVQDDFFNSRGC
jgi:adenosylhomocysteine nucleosidase